MPVLFRCCRCQSVLKVARRKVGRQVQCPRCEAEVIVPASAVVVPRRKKETANGRPSQASPVSENAPREASAVREEDVLAWLGSPTAEESLETPSVPLPPSTPVSGPPGDVPRRKGAGGSSPRSAETTISGAPESDPAARLRSQAEKSKEQPAFEPLHETVSAAGASAAAPRPGTSPPQGKQSPPETPAPAAPRRPDPAAPVLKKARSGQNAPQALSPADVPPAQDRNEETLAPVVPERPGGGSAPASRPLVVWTLEADSGRETPPYVLVSRTAVFLQAALMLLGALLLGWGGYYLGSRRAEPVVQLEEGQVLLSGTVLYWNQQRQVVPDQGAVVLLLPVGRRPARPLSARVFQPGQSPRNNDPNVLRLEEWGGAVARVDTAGNYRLAVPGAGTYWVLILSRHARRPRDRSVEKQTMHFLQQWFSPAGVLVGRSKYLFQQIEVPAEAEAPVYLHHFFGQGAQQ